MSRLSRAPSVQSQHSSFDDDRTVDPWRHLLADIVDNCSADDLQKNIFKSKDKLGDRYDQLNRLSDSLDESTQSNVFLRCIDILEDNYGKDWTADYLEKLFHDTYGDLENYSFGARIKQYKIEKQAHDEKCRQKWEWKDDNFVGREEYLLKIMSVLQLADDLCKGVILCGLSGMGKTSLAGEICWRLMKCSKPPWEIIVVNQREKSEFCDLIKDLIDQLSQSSGENLVVADGDDNSLKLQFLKLLEETVEKRNLLYMDNLDGHCDTPDKLRQLKSFIGEILRLMATYGSKCQTRLLLTVGRKLGEETDHLGRYNKRFKGQMLEIELTEMNVDDTSRVLNKISETRIGDSDCAKICTLCCGSPLSIRHIAVLVKDGCSVNDIISCLKTNPSDKLILGDQMGKCLQRSLDSLDKSMRTILVRLSVFQSAQFNIDAAIAVCENEISLFIEQKPLKNDLRRDGLVNKVNFNLRCLKSKHLLEIDNLSFSKRRQNVSYSLHPLVSKFLCAMSDKELKCEREEATLNFLKYFCFKIVEWGKRQDKKPVDTSVTVQQNMVHVKSFFQLMLKEDYEFGDLIPDKHKESPSLYQLLIWKIASQSMPETKKRLIAKKQCEKSRPSFKLYDYVFWQCMEAEILFVLDKFEIAEKKIEELSEELGVVYPDCSSEDYKEVQFRCLQNGWTITKEDQIQASGVYSSIQGRIYKHRKMYDRSLNFYQMAQKSYRIIKGHKRSYFKTTLAQILNKIGCVHFVKGQFEQSQDHIEEAFDQFEKAKAHHQEAYDITRKLVENSPWHEDFAEYLSNIGSCSLQQGLNSKDEKVREKSLLEATIKYNDSISKNKLMKRDTQHCHAVTLRNRAIVYSMQGLYKDALQDGVKMLEIMEKILAPPNIELSLAIETAARHYLKYGQKLKEESNQNEANKHFQEALVLYDRLLEQIRIGGLPIDHNNYKTYREIEKKHLKVMKELKFDDRRRQRIMKFYQDFQTGKCDKKIAETKRVDIDFDMEEYLAQAVAEGKTFVMESCSETESEEESDTESSPRTSTSRTSSSSDKSMKSDGEEEAQAMRQLDQDLARRRKDSGFDDPEEGAPGGSFDDDMDLFEQSEPVQATSSTENQASVVHEPDIEMRVKLSGSVSSRDSGLSEGSNRSSHLQSSFSGDNDSTMSKFKKPVLRRQSGVCESEVLLEEGLAVESPNSQTVQSQSQKMPNRKRRSIDMQRISFSSLDSIGEDDEPRPGTSTETEGCLVSPRMGESCRIRAVSESSQQLRVSWGSRSSEGSGSTDKNRRDLVRSGGSQDSVTSQLGRKLNISTESVEEGEDMSQEDEPTRKKVRIESDVIQESSE